MKFSNKVLVVTGGGNGIGREIVLQLLNQGAFVVAVDLNEKALKELKELAKNHAKRLSTYVLDVTNKEAVFALPKKVLTKHKKIDGIFNVAGIIQPFVTINELNFEEIDRVFNVNFSGPLYIIKAFLPHLLKNETTSYIANVSSMGGFLPVPGQGIYGASKAALKLLSEALYAELLETNVKVSTIFPGAIATNITENSNVTINVGNKDYSTHKTLPANKAAKIIIDGVGKNKFKILVGKDAKIIDKLNRLAPRFSVHTIQKNMKELLELNEK